MTVVMVTGAYFPEISGAGLQCRALIRACGDRVRFRVLTTSVDPGLPATDTVEGVPVHRVLVSPHSRLARAFALPRLIFATIRAAAGADIVHLHGFSSKSRVVMAIARLMGKPVIIKLTSVGHDDALSMRQKGGGAFRSFCHADRFVGLGPRFAALHAEAGLPAEMLTVIPNGVDLERFRPAAPGERAAIRTALGVPVDRLLVLFVGFMVVPDFGVTELGFIDVAAQEFAPLVLEGDAGIRLPCRCVTHDHPVHAMADRLAQN